MKRAMNFSAGPATLPLSVLQETVDEFFDFKGTGKSVLESSHRSPEYAETHAETQSLIKELLGVGEGYKVAFFGGGASTQFALAPMNLLKEGQTADYLVTGSWSQKAVKEAKLFGDIHIAYDPSKEDGSFIKVPQSAEDCSFSQAPSFVHLTSNNTIAGTQYHGFPQTDAPLIADMSSDFLWAPFDVSRFGLIYAGAQKNLGPAGVTIVLIREDVLSSCKEGLPAMFDYKLQVSKDSLYNTPPCYGIYMVGKVCAWIKREGGLAAMEQKNREKAGLLYETIEKHGEFFRCPAQKESRSMMNVVFRLPTQELEKQFIAEGKAQNMLHLKGHRSVGGIRVSIYNAAELAWVKALTDFMEEFVRKNG
jgi:phosphoserine aminotransferase